MVGIGNNKSNISAIDPDSASNSIEDIGDGLQAGAEDGEESKKTNYIEALQFTGQKPKHNKAKPSSTDQAEPMEQINFEDTMQQRKFFAS